MELFTQSFGSLMAKTITAIASRATASEWIGARNVLFILPFCSDHSQDVLEWRISMVPFKHPGNWRV
ncbi:MAG: hypothetical protein CMN94_08110 [Synechococcus sp. EAC657]|nr:hypothetical protein [Synechococcus sp. EAC657]